MRHWAPEADDDYLQELVEMMIASYGKERLESFWLVRHSQGGMTSNRLLESDDYANRVDGWLSLSGGRIGPAEIPASFFAGGRPRPRMPAFSEDGPAPGRVVPPDCDFSFIFATGELEIVELPETSLRAERYGAGPGARLPDVVGTEPGQVTGASWGREARPGTAEVYVCPDAQDGRVIADVVRLDKGHTEGLEPKIVDELLKMMAAAPGGKLEQLK